MEHGNSCAVITCFCAIVKKTILSSKVTLTTNKVIISIYTKPNPQEISVVGVIFQLIFFSCFIFR